MTTNRNEVPGFQKPSTSDLSKMSRDEITQFLAASVGRLSNLYPHWLLLSVESPFGIPSSRFMVMWLLRKSKTMSMGQIAHSIDLTPRGISRIVDGLEIDGLAIRVTDENDKRIKNVKLTTHGERFINRALPEAVKAFDEIFSAFNKSEAIELIRLLERLTDKLKSQIDRAE